ncbi:MAG TPA: selenocysteine-specific translation elongation factor [Gemmatimonadales bacterium]|nr:selenocysteine-specific translation elongation factor [Gemmatimonadales bacterium]
MIIGTAGHIDHGKSSLVTALTGQAMDRLVEERRREITIELNFAPLDLGQGGTAGVVDVPGHEDFIRTMVAGASGIDLALLVIASDEGIMPQTEEHLLILEQLRVRRGIPVITKADLSDPEWIELVSQEVSERLQASSISFDAPIVVSARTGQGLDALRSRLAAHAALLGGPAPGDAFRMPIDRVFSLPGVGTVVTGTVWSGRVTAGETVTALPNGLRGRVRSLESFGRSVAQAESGARTAIALVGIERAHLARGAVLVTDQLPWSATSALDVELALDSRAPRPITPRARIRVLLGTTEVISRVQPRSIIEPGTQGLARLRLESPLVARAGDRFVIRSFSPVTTIGGGQVLDPLPPRRRSVWPSGLASQDDAERFRSLLQRRPEGIERLQLPLLLGLPGGAANDVARKEATARLLDDLWVATTTVEQVGLRAVSLLREYHRSHPGDPGMPLATLRHELRSRGPIIEAALDDFVRSGRIRRREGVVSLAGFTPKVAGGDAEIDRIVGILAEAHLTPPSVTELERSTGRHDLQTLLRLAAARGRVEAVERDRYYTRAALDRFTEVLHEMGREGAISPAAVRDRLGISRKFLIPLLEWADDQGITVREGDGRRLKSLASAADS